MNRFQGGTTTGISYWQVFRLIFVIFSLYLVGDAFYRWDGFRYYASFSEFLPGVALVAILWSIVALFAALMLWLPVRALEWFCLHRGCKVKGEYSLQFIYILVFLGVIVWAGKWLIWQSTPTTLQLKLIVFSGAIFASIFLTWLFHNKAGPWMNIVHERITPLVWLFGSLVILSVPLVTYQIWGKQTGNNVASQKNLPPPITNESHPNIVLVTFDALTARDMSVYGYHRPTTPFITEWAKEASLFTRLQAESNFTTPATASLVTGKRLWTHQTYHLTGSKPVRSGIENLPLLLKKNGYYTMAFVANPVASVKTLGIANSFEIAPIASEFSVPASLFRRGEVVEFGIIDAFLYRLFGDEIRLHEWIVKENFILHRFVDILNMLTQDSSKITVPPEKVFDRFLSVIDNNPPEPFFAWIHVLPPHAPYLPPKPYKGMFAFLSKPGGYDSRERELQSKYKQQRQSFIVVKRARYDEFIRYCDNQFEDFIEQLAKKNKLKNTVVILSSDHGESFEHNYTGHSKPHLYEQVTHIPLIIKEPNQTKGRIISDITEQIDIPATILDLAEIPVPSWMDGRSLIPLMRGEGLSSKPAFSMNFEKNRSRGHQITKGTIAVWEGDYKLIHYLEEEKSLLFNLKQDTGELNNLFDKEPEEGQRLLNLIKNNLKKANARISRGE